MRLHLASRLTWAAVFVFISIPVYSQVAPSATEGGLPLVVGAGFSDFDIDFGKDFGTERRMTGPTIWADWNFYGAKGVLKGLGIEAEARDINYDRPASLSRMRQDTGAGGPIYTVRRFHNAHLYAKILLGIGSLDFPTINNNPYYHHDTFTVFTPGGGGEYRIYKRFWVRADWQYQFWREVFGGHDLNPNGYTIGAEYDFRHLRER